MRSVNKMVFLFLASALFWTAAARAAEEVSGKTFYTTANIWYDQPGRIESTNYHYGSILPIGAKVKITEVNDTTPVAGPLDSDQRELFIRFSDETGQSYKIIFMSRYARPGMSVWDHLKQYFSENDQMAEGGAFKSLTADEQKWVKSGEIASGMSKKAVLMAYGYPPGHRTPSLDLDRWVYWINLFQKRAVDFKDDKVVEPKRRNTVSPIDECIRACKENTDRTSERCFDDCRRQ